MHNKIKSIIAAATFCGAIFAAFNASASDASKSCLAKQCTAGDKGITVADRADPYYACPTRELSEYANAVIGIVALDAQFGGKMRNISPKTGEPEFLDDKNGPNSTRVFLDHLRKAAGVKTFDQAVGQCVQGKNNLRINVMNAPEGTTSIWVMDVKAKQSFWMPSASIDKK